MNGILNYKHSTSRTIFACIMFSLLHCMILISCKKENPIKTDCIPIPPYQEVGWGYNYILDSSYFTRPNFNPNNPNEIIFVKETGLNNKLIKYNLITKEKKVLYEGTIIFQPKWGKNDWILLNLPDANIWRIKSNGDSLTKLTNTGGFYQPEWGNNSEIYFYDCCAPHNIIKIDFLGNIKDTFPNNLPTNIVFFDDTLIVYQYIGSINSLNLLTKEISTMLVYTDSSPIHGMITKINNNNLIFYKSDGIYSLNLLSHNLKMLKSTCNSKVYCFPTYSFLIDKIIWQRVDYTLIDKHNVFVKSKLYIMNSDGTNEKRIEILDN